MKAATTLKVGFRSHPGLHRTGNEDRILIDETHSIFLIADGLGGHAAGETAAEIAAETIREHLIHSDIGTAWDQRIKKAITEANNRIFELAQSHREWSGMACVLTLAVVQDEGVIVGHVGDSRLYLLSQEVIRKVTSDHSPVGGWEESGQLSEKEAMGHPRRHEVFRDVGSQQRQWDDPEFVQTIQLPFSPDAALLFCTDGLTDAVTIAEISRTVDQHAGDSERIAESLINAANQAGGRDNVSVIFVAGPQFSAGQRKNSPRAANRHAITRVRTAGDRWTAVWPKVLPLLLGMAGGILIWATSERLVPQVATSAHNLSGERPPKHIAVNPTDPRSVLHALAAALPGDTIDVPPGDYLGPLMLRSQVNLVGSLPRRAVFRSDPTALSNPGVAITVSGAKDARIENVDIMGDETHPLRTGISILNSTVHIVNSKVSGATEAGIRIEGKSEAVLLADVLSRNFGAGLMAGDQSLLRANGNWITGNGEVPGALRAGIEIAPTVTLEAANNLFGGNGLPDLSTLQQTGARQLQQDNIFGAAQGANRAERTQP